MGSLHRRPASYVNLKLFFFLFLFLFTLISNPSQKEKEEEIQTLVNSSFSTQLNTLLKKKNSIHIIIGFLLILILLSLITFFLVYHWFLIIFQIRKSKAYINQY